MDHFYIKHARRAIPLLLLLCTALCLSSCGQVWDWLWTRDRETPVDSADLIMGDSLPEEDWIFEGAVSFTGEAHRGTDIYYVGDRESPNCTRVIVIDAGHQLKASSAKEPVGPGSTETKNEVSAGATGVYTGQTEYELNLKVALLLRDELIRRGYSVVMIRETNDVSISNMERAEIANKYNAAAFIRIHANSWTDQRSGAMAICQTRDNPYPDCARHYERSRLLSELILQEFCDETGMEKATNSLYESDDYTGTNWSRVPTTILEMGYLSNPSDDELMSFEYFRHKAAVGIADGLDAYFRALVGIETENEAATESPTEAVADETLSTDTAVESADEAATEAVTDTINGYSVETPAEEPEEASPDAPQDAEDSPAADEAPTDGDDT